MKNCCDCEHFREPVPGSEYGVCVRILVSRSPVPTAPAIVPIAPAGMSIPSMDLIVLPSFGCRAFEEVHPRWGTKGHE